MSHPCGDPTCTEDHGEERAMDPETYHLLSLIGIVAIIILLLALYIRPRR